MNFSDLSHLSRNLSRKSACVDIVFYLIPLGILRSDLSILCGLQCGQNLLISRSQIQITFISYISIIFSRCVDAWENLPDQT